MRVVLAVLAVALGGASCGLLGENGGDAQRVPPGDPLRLPDVTRRFGQEDPGSTATPTPTPATPTPVPSPTPCVLHADEEGRFERLLEDGTFYAGVIAGTAGDVVPMRLFVGLHGCGQDAHEFLEEAVAPEEIVREQRYVGISVESGLGPGECWEIEHEPIVLRAIADVSACVAVDPRKIVVGGYSSGGEVAYHLGLRHAELFAGILAQNTSLSAAGDADELAAEAAWRLPIAHVAHLGDGSYPIAEVREDWALLRSEGFPVFPLEKPGGHSGSTSDWVWLLRQMEEWEFPAPEADPTPEPEPEPEGEGE